MTLSAAYNIVNSSFAANAAQTAVVSKNIANANTDGYSREIANVLTNLYGGADVDSITREANGALRDQVASAISQGASQQAIADGTSPIVVDRGNGLNAPTQEYVCYALRHGYQVELREPDSPWWSEIRELLRDNQTNETTLRAWAARLADLSRQNHHVPLATILDWMFAWKPDLTVEDIANLKPR